MESPLTADDDSPEEYSYQEIVIRSVADSTPVILGAQRNNPFTAGTMTQAWNELYGNSNKTYALEYAIVPRNAGLFYFFHAAIQSFDEDQNFPGRCPRVPSNTNVELNGGAGNKIEFLSASPDPHYNDWVLQRPQQRFHNGGGYCFYVVE